MDKINSTLDQIMPYITKYAGTIVLAIIVLIVGWWLINKLVRHLGKRMEKKEVDASLRPFLKSITKIALRVMLVISIAGMIGIQMTSFIAVLGAAGLAVGLALQGSLTNFAGGIIILLLKPFKVGDFIEAKDFMGTVREIHIFFTYITTPSQQEMVVPNGQLANSYTKNYSFHPTRRMDIPFRVSYSIEFDKVKKILSDIISNEKGLVNDPAHEVYIIDLAEQYMVVNLRAFFKSEDYWTTYNYLREKVKKRFEEEGINIPYPKMDVTLKK